MVQCTRNLHVFSNKTVSLDMAMRETMVARTFSIPCMEPLEQEVMDMLFVELVAPNPTGASNSKVFVLEYDRVYPFISYSCIYQLTYIFEYLSVSILP